MNLQPLGNTGFLIDPASGKIVDPKTNRVYNNPEEIAASFSQYEAPKQEGGGQSGAGGLAGGLGTAVTGYQASQALGLGGATSAPVVAPAATSGGYQLAGTLGSQGVADLSVAGAQSANAANTGTSALGGYATTAAPYLGAAAFAYNQYNEAPKAYQMGAQYDMPTEAAWQNYKDSWTENKSAGDWAKKAFDFFTFQDLLNGGYAALGSAFGSKRKIDRDLRKAGRKSLKDSGIVDQNSSELYNLASGNQFNIRDYANQSGKQAYNIDWEDPNLNKDKVAFLDAISTARMGNKGKVGKASSDITGELYNAARSDGNFENNVRFYGDKAGGRDAIYGAIAERWGKDKSISAEKRDAMFAAIDKEYGIANPNNQRWDATLTGKDLERNQKEMAEAAKKNPQAAKPPIAPRPNPNAFQTLPMGTPIPKGGAISAKPQPTKNPYLKAR